MILCLSVAFIFFGVSLLYVDYREKEFNKTHTCTKNLWKIGPPPVKICEILYGPRGIFKVCWNEGDDSPMVRIEREEDLVMMTFCEDGHCSDGGLEI